MLIDINELSFAYADNTVFSDVQLQINESDRIGLVGNNGVGKTTLIKVIIGELTPTVGNLNRKQSLSVGYLRQNAGLDSDNTIFEEMKAVFLPVTNALKRLDDLNVKMSSTAHDSLLYRQLASEVEALHSYIAATDGYNVDVKIKTVLNGMGFINRYDQIIRTMSGGEKTRLAIAKLLLEAPELLILDEPTNHLDFKTLIWLEDFLATYKGALLIVSHDRYFLDKTVRTIWELEDKQAYKYSGNYTKYKLLKQELIQSRLKEYTKQSVQIAAMEDYIARNMVRATTSKSAKSRVHRLAQIERIEKPRTFTKPPHFSFTFQQDSNKVVLSVSNLEVSVDGYQLLEDVNFEVGKQERVAILGANGTGKSTLIRALIANDNRHIRFGKDVSIGYYDQENLNINMSNTVLDELWGRHHRESQTAIRSILGGLLLGEDDIQKPVSVLSGGERAKLGFAIIMAEHANTLILDEPTNHLDLMTREALEDALRSFDGTVIFVSHDRYFLDRIATSVLEIENKRVTRFIGNYTKYEAQKREIQAKKAAEEQALIQDKPIEKKAYRTAKDRSAEVKRKQQLQAAEAQITALESEQQELNARMLQPEVLADYQQYNKMQAEYNDLQQKISDAYDAWEKLSLDL